MYKSFFKRFFDFIISLTAFIIILPFFLIVWLCLSIANKKGGAFFIQDRPGKNREVFKVIKFKTMTDVCDEEGNLLPDSERLTKIGKFIRSTSLDEIPQLLNVIKGDMSLIGPRPLLVEYLPLYTDIELRRHEVRPGITGWAQINGRNAIAWKEKFAYDVWYVEHLSLALDIHILLKTIKKVFKREDINQDGQATTQRFTGTH